MNIFSNSEVPISETDRTEIEAIFIELMRERDAPTHASAENAELPFFDPPGNAQDLRSQWGL